MIKDKASQPKTEWSKMKDNDWRKKLHIAMEECQPADFYYKFVEALLSQSTTEFKKSLKSKVLEYTADELKIAREEKRTPASFANSRITRLSCRIMEELK